MVARLDGFSFRLVVAKSESFVKKVRRCRSWIDDRLNVIDGSCGDWDSAEDSEWS